MSRHLPLVANLFGRLLARLDPANRIYLPNVVAAHTDLEPGAVVVFTLHSDGKGLASVAKIRT